MALVSKPIYASDITGLSTPGSPVTVKTKRSVNLDRPLAHGWLESAAVQPGFEVFAASYDSHEAYDIDMTTETGFLLGLNLGDVDSADIPKRELVLPGGHFGTIRFDEPSPIQTHRGQRKHQERCGIVLTSEWIATGMFERFDDTGLVSKVLKRPGISDVAPASPALLSAAARLFGAFNADGPLAGLRREAAALAFFAEAFSGIDEARRPRDPSRIDIVRIRLLKEMLDTLPPDVHVGLVELAAAHDMSVRSMCRHFRQTYGTTIVAYVAERRMENARTGLERRGFTVDQAAYIAGFAHTSNFSSAFRRRYGYRPGGHPPRGRKR